MHARIQLALLIACASACMAGDGFRFYVTDQFSGPKLQYSTTQDITIYTFEQQEPRLVFGKGQSVDGVKQENYTFTSEAYAGDLPDADYEAFLKKVRLLPLKPLISSEEDYQKTHGWLKLDGKEYIIKAAPDSKARKQWQTELDRFIEGHAEKQ